MRGSSGTRALVATVLLTVAATGCSANPASEAPTTSTPTSSGTSAAAGLSASERKELCALLPVAVTTTVDYYKHTMNMASPPTIHTVVDQGAAILGKHTDAEILSDEVADAFIGWRGSLIRGERASAAAFATWDSICSELGLNP